MWTALQLLGVLMIVSAAAYLSVPAAVIVAGALVLAYGWHGDR